MRGKLKGLLRGGTSPHDISLGLAVGVGVSFFPVYGPQMPACLALVAIFRKLNRVAVFLGVQFSWLYPVVVYLDYKIGRLMVPGEHPIFSFSEIREKGLSYLVSLVWELFPVLLAGFAVVSVVAGVATYFIARGILSLRRERAV